MVDGEIMWNSWKGHGIPLVAWLGMAILGAACRPGEDASIPASQISSPVQSSSSPSPEPQGSPPGERHIPFPHQGKWTIPGGVLELHQGSLTWQDGEGARLLAREGVGLPQVGKNVLVASALRGRSDGQILAWDLDSRGPSETPRVLLDRGGRPDRVSLSPDETDVAFVWGITGLASVYRMPVAGGEPVQLTNRNVLHFPSAPGHPPQGFQFPPWKDPPRWEGEWLRWTGGAGEKGEVRWR